MLPNGSVSRLTNDACRIVTKLNYIQGVQEKLLLYPIHYQQSLARVSVQEIVEVLNTMRVYSSHSYWLAISEQPIAAQC